MSIIKNALYLIDTNTLIQAKNFHYQFNFCSSFWEWILAAHKSNIVCTIEKVKKEVFRGDKEDVLKKWTEDNVPCSFFHNEMQDPLIMKKYADIIAWSSNHARYNQKAKEDFADIHIADAFLIATAAAYNLTIVSHEKSAPNSLKSIKIPDAADAFNVKTITLYELLNRHAQGSFHFKL